MQPTSRRVGRGEVSRGAGSASVKGVVGAVAADEDFDDGGLDAVSTHTAMWPQPRRSVQCRTGKGGGALGRVRSVAGELEEDVDVLGAGPGDAGRLGVGGDPFGGGHDEVTGAPGPGVARIS
jgi:hypothetical protein